MVRRPATFVVRLQGLRPTIKTKPPNTLQAMTDRRMPFPFRVWLFGLLASTWWSWLHHAQLLSQEFEPFFSDFDVQLGTLTTSLILVGRWLSGESPHQIVPGVVPASIILALPFATALWMGRRATWLFAALALSACIAYLWLFVGLVVPLNNLIENIKPFRF